MYSPHMVNTVADPYQVTSSLEPSKIPPNEIKTNSNFIFIRFFGLRTRSEFGLDPLMKYVCSYTQIKVVDHSAFSISINKSRVFTNTYGLGNSPNMICAIKSERSTQLLAETN